MPKPRPEIVEKLYRAMIEALLEPTAEHDATSGEVVSAAMTLVKGLSMSMMDHGVPEHADKNRESLISALENIMLAIYEQKKVM